MKNASWIILLLMTVALVACGGGNSNNDTNPEDDTQRRLFDWERNSDYVLFRIDVIDEAQPESVITNTIPPCTIYGDGRLIFSVVTEGGLQVLEARLSEAEIRAFVETVIGRGFYSWEDDVFSNADLNRIESISLNLYAELRTVERYGDWPLEAYQTLISDCQNLSERRAVFQPLNGGWLRAIPIDTYDRQAEFIEWPNRIPFTLGEVAASGSPQWVSDPTIATFLWNSTALTERAIPIVIRDEVYLITFQVPGVSRTSPPMPTDLSSALPTLEPLPPQETEVPDEE